MTAAKVKGNRQTDLVVAVLRKAAGCWVAKEALAAATGIPSHVVGARVLDARQHYPDVAIESERALGYRIPADVPASAYAHVIPMPPRGPRRGEDRTLHQRLADNQFILDALPAKTAELVKTIAYESGETIDAALHRLISYGAEVHVDLLVAGHPPLALRRQPLTESDMRRSGMRSDAQQVPA